MNQAIRCLVIEDEPLAQNILKKYIGDLASLELVAVCNDALEAQGIVQSKNIQLLFLDINLPKLSGINFLKTLPNPPAVIFTTAYPEFAGLVLTKALLTAFINRSNENGFNK